MIVGIQYNYYVNDSFNKTFFVAGGWDTHKVYLDMGCFESQSIYPVIIWKKKKKGLLQLLKLFYRSMCI